MDIRMPRMDGLEATKQLAAADDAPAVIVLTTFDADEYVVAALRDGATGFLLKDTPPATIVDAVHQVADGEPMLSPSVTAQLIRQVAMPRPPTGRPRDSRTRAAGRAERTRARGRRRGRRGQVERRDRRRALHERGDRQGARVTHPDQARRHEPRPDRDQRPRRRPPLTTPGRLKGWYGGASPQPHSERALPASAPHPRPSSPARSSCPIRRRRRRRT